MQAGTYRNQKKVSDLLEQVEGLCETLNVNSEISANILNY